MSDIINRISSAQVSQDVILHCLYGRFFLHMSIKKLAVVYHKHRNTISNWIQRYNSNRLFTERQIHRNNRKFHDCHRDWIVNLYNSNPLLYLEEAKERFESEFNIQISTSTISLILHQKGYSYKTIERRAIQIRVDCIVKFEEEISCLPWLHSNLVFLDEVSFDNRCMLRNKGYAIRGKKLIHRGEFRRRPRESLLCFLGESGIFETFSTEGTFNRLKFFEACKKVALGGKVQEYPGRLSIWILDGARIHCDKAIIYYLRSLGIFPIFLPPYCPFFNPIELIFGLLKKHLKKIYVENDKRELIVVILTALKKFEKYRCNAIFEKCGYQANGKFNPERGMDQSLKKFDFNLK